MKKAILFRMGGLGDILICTIVPRQLRKMGYDVVDACFGSPTADPVKILEDTHAFDHIHKYTRSFSGVDCYEAEDGDLVSIEVLKDDYDLVVDYKFSVELNSHYKHLASAPGKEWFVSQNSNYQNWADIMLSWAGIDPASVPDDEKIPMYSLKAQELEWALGVAGRNDGGDEKVVAIQTNASSLVRTFYYPMRLPEAIKIALPEQKFTFLLYDGANWLKMKDGKQFPVLFPDNVDRLRYSAALLGACDLFVGADSGFSHLAEAIGVPSVTIYTTVPAWTRMKYYRHSYAVEPIGDVFNDVKCHPCFLLDRYCTRIKEEALAQRTPREIKLLDAVAQNRNPLEVAEEFGTTPQGIIMEADMASKRIEALFERQSPCSLTVTPERIAEKVREVFGA